VEGILRGCQGLFTPVSLEYPLSVFNKKLYSQRKEMPRLCRDLTPGLAPSQHLCMPPHLTPTSSPPTPLHPLAISILAINCLSGTCCWAWSRQPLRTERPSTSPHALAMYTKEPWLYPPPPLTKERSSVGRAQAPHGLVSCWGPFSIHSSNGLGCIV